MGQRFITVLVIALSMMAETGQVRAAEDLSQRRAQLDESFALELAALAKRCEELKLTAEAKTTRAWIFPRDPGKLYLFVPARAPQKTSAALGAGDAEKWRAQFLEIRRRQAAGLFALAGEAIAAGQRELGLRWLHETLHEDLDHAAARAALGYAKVGAIWQQQGTTSAPRTSRLAHPVFGWTAGKYWRLETPHYEIVTSHSQAEGIRLGERLEELQLVWRQLFPDFWLREDELRARLKGWRGPAESLKKMRVVLFRNRAEYAQKLAASGPQIGSTLGIYLDREQMACFFAGDEQAEATWLHEGVHQLFQEMSRAPAGLAKRGHMAMIEGVALYFESMRRHDGYCTLGGIDAARLQFARYHALLEGADIPLAELVALNRDQMQRHARMSQLYSQSAGITQMLMHARLGAFREPFAKYLGAVYADADLPAEAFAQRIGMRPEELEIEYRRYLNVTDEDALALARSTARPQKLALGRTPISKAGIAALAEHAADLDWLDLAFTSANDESLRLFSVAKRLRQLNLEGTQISERSLAVVAGFHEIEELDLSQTSVDDTALRELTRLPKLKVLWLTGTPITDAAVDHLAKMTSLQVLGVKSTRISPVGFKRLNESLPNLKQPVGAP